MIILEALALKTDLDNRIENLGNRYVTNITVLHGKTPHEDPKKLLEEIDENIAQLNDLCYRIDVADLAVKNSEGKTLIELVIDKKSTETRLEILRRALNEVTFGTWNEYGYTSSRDVDFDTVIDIDTVTKQVDECAEKLRKLNSEIEKLNIDTEI